MDFTNVNLRGHVVEKENPNMAWFNPKSDSTLPNYAQEDNDRWLFQTGSMGWQRVKPMPFTYRQHLEKNMHGLLIRNLTDGFLECGMSISEHTYFYEVIVKSYVVPLNDGYMFIWNAGPSQGIFTIFVAETDTRLKSIKKMRNYYNELLMHKVPAITINQRDVLCCGNLY